MGLSLLGEKFTVTVGVTIVNPLLLNHPCETSRKLRNTKGAISLDPIVTSILPSSRSNTLRTYGLREYQIFLCNNNNIFTS